MSLFQTNKPKSAAKIMMPPSQELEDIVVNTLSHIASIVGASLGPGGRQVLIERPEMGMKPIVTKDGATIIKHLGYESATRQLILETARDAALTTASDAGDGTTTATVLSSSIATVTAEIVRANPRLSPQKLVRAMQEVVPFIIDQVNKYKIIVDADNYREILLKIATLSANGDTELSKVVIDAFDTVGEEGNMTIVEQTGPSKYEVERINGYTIDRGYEESARNFANGFINDRTGTQVVLNNPVFVLFDGTVSDISQVVDFFTRMGNFFVESGRHDRGVVFVAHGFAESVIAEFHTNWNHAQSTIKVFPLVTPDMAIMNWKTNFLYDLQAYTGSPVFNPLDRPLVDADLSELAKACKVKEFECGRFRASVVAEEDPTAVEIRVDELKLQKEKAESGYELNDLEVRIGKLTSGIARLIISGPSQGETREKRDRAEDAWMAIRGAIKHGACPGGGWVLVKLAAALEIAADRLKGNEPRRLAMKILAIALLRPVEVLYTNYGYNSEEIMYIKLALLQNEEQTFDISEQKWVDCTSLLDSVPAVIEAIRNSISIASLLGTVGGIIAFQRDNQTDKEEERFIRNYQAAVGERGH